jgi:hypothetical protein
MINNQTESHAMPFDLFRQGGVNIVFEPGPEKLALPLIALQSIHYRKQDVELIVMEFPEHHVEIQGTGLEGLFDFLADHKVRVIRSGQTQNCAVHKIIVAAG